MKTKAIGRVLTTFSAVAFGFLLGISFPVAITPKVQCGIPPWSGSTTAETNCSFGRNGYSSTSNATSSRIIEVAARTDASAGAERRLPPGIVVSESDLHLRRLWGSPAEDSPEDSSPFLAPLLGEDAEEKSAAGGPEPKRRGGDEAEPARAGGGAADEVEVIGQARQYEE